MTDVAKVAAELTEVQRRALLDTYDLGFAGERLIGFKHGRSCQSLRDKGIARPAPWRGAPATLTPLGLAVRAHLANPTEGTDHG